MSGLDTHGKGSTVAYVVYRWLADVVVVVHLGFILFVAVGGVLAWRWRWLIWLHIPSVAWGVGVVWLGFDCPLTPLERHLREAGGEGAYEESFVDRYVEGVIYPAEYTPHLRVLAASLIALGWLRLLLPRLKGGSHDMGRRAEPAR